MDSNNYLWDHPLWEGVRTNLDAKTDLQYGEILKREGVTLTWSEDEARYDLRQTISSDSNGSERIFIYDRIIYLLSQLAGKKINPIIKGMDPLVPMKWSFHHKVQIPVAFEEAWHVLRKIEYWPQWHPTVSQVQMISDSSEEEYLIRMRNGFILNEARLKVLGSSAEDGDSHSPRDEKWLGFEVVLPIGLRIITSYLIYGNQEQTVLERYLCYAGVIAPLIRLVGVSPSERELTEFMEHMTTRLRLTLIPSS